MIDGLVDGLVFIRPWWLIGVLPVIIMAVLWARRRMAASHWETSIDPALLRVLLEPGSAGGFRKMAWLVAGALALGTIGLAGPAWQKLPQPVEEKRDALVIVFDLSLSMFARDVRPSRLVRARQKITDARSSRCWLLKPGSCSARYRAAILCSSVDRGCHSQLCVISDNTQSYSPLRR